MVHRKESVPGDHGTWKHDTGYPQDAYRRRTGSRTDALYSSIEINVLLELCKGCI